MLIDPPNKANAQENTKIFPGLRPRPRACAAAGAGASPQTPMLPPPGQGRYAPARPPIAKTLSQWQSL